MYRGVGDALFAAIIIGAIALGLLIVISLYAGYNYINEYFNGVTIESNHIIKPEWKLEGNGKKVDTVYIYNFKK